MRSVCQHSLTVFVHLSSTIPHCVWFSNQTPLWVELQLHFILAREPDGLPEVEYKAMSIESVQLILL